MWVLTVVGPVNGQQQFAFALEQKRTYSIGRSGECDIRIESTRVRPKEGSLIVGDWDPGNRTSPPELKWRLEPKKDKTFGKCVGILPFNDTVLGSTDKEDYEETELDQAGCWLSSNGQGIKLVDDVWFIAVWQDLHIQFDKMKDQSDEVRDILNRYCISYTLAFDSNDKPTYVLSPALKNNSDCNYAVCYAIRILLPLYLDALVLRLNACWRKSADSQDSFHLPDISEARFQPALDPAVQNIRSEVQQWLPNDHRPTLFQGWKVLCLRAKITPPEKRYLQAMSADYSDIDAVTRPLASANDLEDRLGPWLEDVDTTVGRSNALLIWAAQAKAELIKKIDWNAVVGQTCHQIGIKASSGLVTWGAVKFNSVQKYLESVAGTAPRDDINNSRLAPRQQDVTAALSVPKIDLPVPLLTEPSLPPGIPCSLPPHPTSQPAFVPSTYPDETERHMSDIHRAHLAEGTEEKFPDSSHSQTTTGKVVRRRGARQLNIFDDDQAEPAAKSIQSQQSASQPEARASRVPETQIAASDSQLASLRTNSLLKRRGGPETKRSLLEFDTSVQEETKPLSAEVRELYEQTKAQSMQPPSKRLRTAVPSAFLIDSDVQIEPADRPPIITASVGEVMDVDEDPIQATLRRTAQTKRQSSKTESQHLMLPPGEGLKNGVHSGPTDKANELELHGRLRRTKADLDSTPRKAVPRRSLSPTMHQVTKDSEFLQAVSKASKSKKSVDELDKEFNLLRIPKPGTNPGSNAIRASEWDANHPDYNVVNDFDNDLRGNFIQVVRKDLFRKDLRRVAPFTASDVPNFKKFKKKISTRKEPLQLVLAATIAQAEMGEPYWAPEQTQPIRMTQRGQDASSSTARGRVTENDEDMPLLPSRTRTRRLRDDYEGSNQAMSSSIVRRKISTNLSNQPSVSVSTQRGTRGNSVISEGSSAGTVAAARRMTRHKPQTSVHEEGEEAMASGVDNNPLASEESKNRSGRSPATTLDGPTASLRSTQRSRPRRNLLPADDDDGLVSFKAISKKRRLG